MSEIGEWTQTEIGGRTADVYEPPGVGPFAGAVIFLHPHSLDTLANDVVFTQELAKYGLPCVCPHGGRSWWLDMIVPEFDDAVTPMEYVRETVTGWVTQRWNVEPPCVGLLGIGMGGQGALQLAYRHARQFPVVAAISPTVDFHVLHSQGGEISELFATAEAARQQTVTLHLHPLNWPPHQLFVCDPVDSVWHEGCERLASKLSSMGIPHDRELETSAGGHTRDYFHMVAPRCLKFIADGLAKIRSR